MASPNMNDKGENDRQNVITPEETNYLRIANLLLRVASPAVRVRFDFEFNPGVLASTLIKARRQIEDLKNTKRVINQKQFDLLFPKSGTVSSENFDLTLMICLLRNLASIPIADQLPPHTDTRVGADLSRIKYYRNKISHCDEGTLTDVDFQKYWTDINQAIIRLGGSTYQHKCDDLKVSKLDSNDREIIVVLRNVDRCNDPFPRVSSILMEPLVEEWKKQDVKVVQTRGIQYVWELIQENDVVTVIGSSGCGKTVAVQHTALKLQSQGYRIVPVRSPKEIKEYFYAECKQVFVCNDVCGKYTIDLQVVNEWERYLEDVRLILDSKCVKILCSSKTRIFQNSTFQRIDILALKKCDLLSSKYSLTPSERTQIAALYLTVDEVAEIKVLDLYTRYDFFPIMCEYYSRNKTGDIKKFFTCPVQVIKEELSGLMKRDDQTVYATLAFFVIYNNCIPDSMLSKGSETRNVREEISDICKMPYVFSGQVLKLQIESLNGCYVKKIGNEYSIIHDTVFDLVVEFYGSHMFDIVLEYCHTEIVRDRFQFESVTEDDNNCVIKVPVDKEQIYFNRICKDIKDGHIIHVFTNRQLKHVSYREKFIERIKRTEDVHKILQSVAETQSPLLTVAAMGYIDITDLLIRLSLDVNVQDEKGRTPLMLATIKALLLLEDNTEINICTTGNLPLLYATSCQGFIECVKLLLKYDANPNICDSNGRFPLLLASGETNEDFVKLLLDYGGNPDLIDSEGNTSLIMASSWGNEKIVQDLLNHNCNPDLNGENTDPPLHVALTHGHFNIAEMLLQHNCNPCILNRNKEPSFYIAAKKGYTDLLKKILEKSNTDDIYTHSASSLQAAITRNEIEVVKILLAYNCVPLPSYKSALLNQALQSEKEEIVHVLLQNNFHENLWDRNVDDIDQITDWGKSTMSKLEKDQYHILYDLSEPRYMSNTISFNFFCHFKSNPTQINIAELLSNEKKWFPFIAECRQGKVDNINSYSDTEINKMIDMYNINQETCLLVVSELGHTQIVKFLLEHKCNLELCNRYNQSPLYVASERGHIEIVKLLLEHESNRDVCNYYNQSPLYVASEGGHTEVVKLLLECQCNPHMCDKYNQSPLFVASKGGHTEIVKLLLEHQCNPHLCNKYNQSPLYVASRSGRTEIVKLLLDHKCNPDLCNNGNESPLYVASRGGHIEIVKLLLECQCNPHMCDKYNQSPLYVASRSGRTEIVKLLLDHKCNPDLCNNGNESPLYVASRGGHIEIVKLLMELESNPNLCNFYNQSSLYVASEGGHTEIVKLLLEHKCNPDLCNKDHQSPLYAASERGHTEIVKLLLKYKCNSDLCNKDNKSSLYVASERGNTEIVKLLLEHKCNPGDGQNPARTKSVPCNLS